MGICERNNQEHAPKSATSLLCIEHPRQDMGAPARLISSAAVTPNACLMFSVHFLMRLVKGHPSSAPGFPTNHLCSYVMMQYFLLNFIFLKTSNKHDAILSNAFIDP